MKSLFVLPKINSQISLSLLITVLAINTVQASDYNQAKSHFDKQDYENAYLLFSDLVESDYASLDYSFYLAQSAAALGKTSEAIVAYERVLINHPGDTRSKLELARLYFELNEYGLSKNYFESALKDKVPQTVKNNIEKYLNKINKKTSQSLFSGVAIVGLGHDSNINNAPLASSWNLPVFDLEFNNTTEQASGGFHQEMLGLNHYYNAKDKYGFDINNNLLAYSKFYPSESDYNILYVRYKPSLIFDKADYTIETGLTVDNMRYGSEAYLNSYGFFANLAKVLAKESAFKSEFKLLRKTYQRDIDDGRDSIQAELNNDLFKLIDSRLSWQASIDLVKNTRQSGNLSDVSKQAIRFDNTLSYQLESDLKLSGSIGYTQTNYQDSNALFLNKRKDSTLKLAADIEKVIDKDLSIQGRAEHSINRSNQAAYEYDKNVFIVNLVKRF